MNPDGREGTHPHGSDGMTWDGPDGIHVVSRDGGEPALLLIHGFGAHGRFWRKWRPRLSPLHRSYTVDLLGFGQSRISQQADLSPTAQARRMADLVLTLDDSSDPSSEVTPGSGAGAPMVLVGHSLGAGIALLTTLMLRDQGEGGRVGGLVLISAAVYDQDLPTYLSLARTPGIGEVLFASTPPRWAMRRGLQSIVHRPEGIDAEQVECYREPLRSPRRRKAILRAARQIDLEVAGDLASRLPELDLPTLIVWGEHDSIVSLHLGRRLARELPRAELVVLPGVGHLPPEEDPDGSLTPVLEFIRTRV